MSNSDEGNKFSATLTWLLEGDPAIRWQTLRDLTSAAPKRLEAERNRVARDGWGKRLLALQDAEGTWAGGLYSPKWSSTTYTMLLLRDFGLSPGNRQAHRACKLLLEAGMQPDGGINYGVWASWQKRSETCITGMILSLLSYFRYDDERLKTIVNHLLAQQMDDGGWNCRRPAGATHSSVHTTISVLEGLRFFELHGGLKARAVKAAQRAGREFLLAHRLFRSDRTGEIIKPVLLRFAFPPRWHYDILRALDHFQAVNAPRAVRLADAIKVVQSKQDINGRWALEKSYPGKVHFQLEQPGRPSRWNTLRALRVLKWWAAKR